MGERVRYWTIETGLEAQYGTIVAVKNIENNSITYAEIKPDNGGPHQFLCEGAVWGFELVKPIKP